MGHSFQLLLAGKFTPSLPRCDHMSARRRVDFHQQDIKHGPAIARTDWTAAIHGCNDAGLAGNGDGAQLLDHSLQLLRKPSFVCRNSSLSTHAIQARLASGRVDAVTRNVIRCCRFAKSDDARLLAKVARRPDSGSVNNGRGAGIAFAR